MTSLSTRSRLLAILSLLLSLSPIAVAAEKTSLASSAPVDLAATLGALLLVVGIILGLAWLLKRMRVPGMMGQQGLKIVRQMPVGTKERIAIIQAGEQQFLVGITAHSIQLISELKQPIDSGVTDATPNTPFANQLTKLMKQSQNKKDSQA